MISHLLPDTLTNFIFAKQKQLYQIAADKVHDVARIECDPLEKELLNSMVLQVYVAVVRRVVVIN